MSSTRRTASLLAAAVASLVGVATAAAEAPIARPNSINVSALGILSGGYYAGNYERLLPGGHGVFGELGYAATEDGSTESAQAAGAFGYRWHWRGQQNSGFVGVTAGYVRGRGTYEDNDSNIDLTVSQIGLTANLGKRWAWDNGLNITFRIGGGIGEWQVSTNSDDPDAMMATRAMQGLLEIVPIALEGELSAGYTF